LKNKKEMALKYVFIDQLELTLEIYNCLKGPAVLSQHTGTKVAIGSRNPGSGGNC
jgi:hypothetical protein